MNSPCLLLLAAAAALGADAPRLSGARVLDVGGQVHVLGGRALNLPVALVFLGIECPISRRSVPGLNRLAEEARKSGVDFFGVISDPAVSRTQAREHVKEFAIAFPVLFDASGDLARMLEPTHVPQGFVFAKDGGLIYSGAIDDRQVDLGKERPEPTRRYLAEALGAAAQGKTPAEARTTPVGCLFEAWRPKPGEAGAAPRTVSYDRDIAPLLNAHCVACHRQGEVAPFPLLSYADAAKRARLLARVTAKRLMPPWPPAAGWGEFLDEARLGTEEIARFQAWADAGAPEGEAADLPPPPALPSGWRLGEPDLVVTMPEAFEVPADGRDLFRCFVLPTSLAEDMHVTGVDFQPSARKVVHHALYFLDTAGAARSLDAQDTEPGYKSFGGPGFIPSGGLGGFAPGTQPRLLPEGTARLLPRGADIVLQVHYHPSGKAEKDRSRMGLYFAKQPVEKLIAPLAVLTHRIDIPAGEANYERHASLTLPVPVKLIGVTPHMHYLGREMKAQATTPDGQTIPLIWIQDWNFNWQGQYLYARPIDLPVGTRIDVDARYDNSAENPRNPSSPPRRVRFGEQSTDEMCICFFLATTRSEEDRLQLRRATARALFGR